MARTKNSRGPQPNKPNFCTTTKSHTISKPTMSKPTKLKPPTKAPHATTTTNKTSEANRQDLQTSLREEKEAHTKTLSKLAFLQSDHAVNKGLRMKNLREEIESLTEQLEVEVATTGRLKRQLEDERELRFKRDGTQGFVQIFQNDPELWMASTAVIGGVGKRRREERVEPVVVGEEDLRARKKREDESLVDSQRRGGPGR